MSPVCSQCGSSLEPDATVCPFDGTPIQLEPTKRSDPLIGHQLGDYRIEGRLGAGGMGIVYSGVQVQIGKRVAVKVLRPDLAAEPAQVQRLLQEAQAVNAIRHRGIIDIFGFGQLPDGRHYVVMEELEGESLEDFLDREGALPLADACTLLDELLSALGAAHARGVIHRDLKPGNLFLVTQGDGTRFLKVLDFGLAKRSQRPDGRAQQTSQETVSGTPEFMAPEQVRAEDVGPETDLYSVGVIMFRMVTGRLPFTGGGAIELMHAQLKQPPPVPSSLVPALPPALDALVLGLLEKDRSRRPPSAEAVRTALKQVTAGPRPAPAPLPGPVAKRRPWVILGLGTLVLVLAAAVALVGQRQPPEPLLAPTPPAPVLPPTPVLPQPVAVPAQPVLPPTPIVPEPIAAPEKLPEQAPPRRPRVQRAALEKRIAQLSTRLARRAGPDDGPAPDAVAALNKLKLDLSVASDDRLGTLSRLLDAWEREYLR